MRWPHDGAAKRRDEQLARTRRLTLWAAGSATAASLGLAAALGFALPGHTSAASARPAGPAGTQSGPAAGSGQGAGRGGTGTGTGRHPARHHHRLARPQRPPASTGAPPVVSSGGS
ncbi:MAG: hypothetical protein ACR2FU_23615 [Streptosporangiaceae bacterium]